MSVKSLRCLRALWLGFASVPFCNTKRNSKVTGCIKIYNTLYSVMITSSFLVNWRMLNWVILRIVNIIHHKTSAQIYPRNKKKEKKNFNAWNATKHYMTFITTQGKLNSKNYLKALNTFSTERDKRSYLSCLRGLGGRTRFSAVAWLLYLCQFPSKPKRELLQWLIWS